MSTARSDPSQPPKTPSRTEVFAPSATRGPTSIAFGKGRVAIVSADKIAVLSSVDLHADVELAGAGVGSASDGALIALAWDKLCTLAPGSKTLACIKKITPLRSAGLATVWGAGANVGMFEGEKIRTYSVDGDEVRALGEIATTTGAESIFAALADGGVVWIDNVGTFHHADAQHDLVWSGSDAPREIRHVAAGPVGHVWIAYHGDTLALIKLGSPPQVVRSVPGQRIVALAATATHVATVKDTTQHVPHVVVRDLQGTVVLDRPLPSVHWPVGVALSAFEPPVGVGRDGQLIVWKLDGTLVGQRAPSK